MKFFDIAEYENKLKAVSIFIGGRGIGKTYSALTFLDDTEKIPFIYMRNTDVQLRESCTAFGNPFKRWNKDHDRNICMSMEKNHAVITEEGEILGYGAALSTFENMRGVDLSDVKYVLFDEFIERKRYTFHQFEAFVNFYETVNRNRELLGEPPLICIMLSNAQKLDNPILMGYNLIPVIESMKRTGQQTYSNKGSFVCLPESEISDLKAGTQNYQNIKGSKIADEALKNDFAFDSFYGIRKRPLKEYVGLCMIDDIYIYKHKSANTYYACSSQCKNIPEFNSRDNWSLFFRTYGRFLELAAASGDLSYSDFVIKSKLSELLR